MFRRLASLSLASALALAAGCAADGGILEDSDRNDQDGDIVRVLPTQSATLNLVWAVHALSTEDSLYRLYEFSGGDPAVNGTLLALNAMRYDGFELSTFDTGLDVRQVDSVRLDGDSIAVDATLDTMVGEGVFESVSQTFSLSVAPDLSELTVDGKPISPELNADPLLDQIHAVHVMEDQDEPLAVRLVETSFGDPAMNGNVLLVNVMGFFTGSGRTFETGIDVAEVVSVELDSEADVIKLEAMADTLDGEGMPVREPRSYEMSYGTPDGALEVLRTR